MPRGGPPTYTYSLPPIYLAIPGTIITAAQHNTPLEDIALTLNTAWPVNLGGTGGSSKQGAIDSLFDGTTSVKGTNLRISDSIDASKLFIFDASQIAASTTRTLKIPNASGTVALFSDLAKVGQCRFDLVSSTSCALTPFGGDKIAINGNIETIPSTGVSLAVSGLTAGTNYYVYAYMNSGTMALEASTTGHATSTLAGNVGVEIKSGDNTRTLVGMVSPDTGPVFVDDDTRRYVISWFNRRVKRLRAASTTNASTTSTSPVELSSPTLRLQWLSFGLDAVDMSYVAPGQHSAVGGGIFFNVFYQKVGAAGGVNVASAAGQAPAANTRIIQTGSEELPADEGRFFMYPSVWTTTGTFSIPASASGFVISGSVMG